MKKNMGPRIGGRYVNAEGKKKRKDSCLLAEIPGLFKKGPSQELFSDKVFVPTLVHPGGFSENEEYLFELLEQAGY